MELCRSGAGCIAFKHGRPLCGAMQHDRLARVSRISAADCQRSPGSLARALLIASASAHAHRVVWSADLGMAE